MLTDCNEVASVCMTRRVSIIGGISPEIDLGIRTRVANVMMAMRVNIGKETNSFVHIRLSSLTLTAGEILNFLADTMPSSE